MRTDLVFSNLHCCGHPPSWKCLYEFTSNMSTSVQHKHPQTAYMCRCCGVSDVKCALMDRFQFLMKTIISFNHKRSYKRISSRSLLVSLPGWHQADTRWQQQTLVSPPTAVCNWAPTLQRCLQNDGKKEHKNCISFLSKVQRQRKSDGLAKRAWETRLTPSPVIAGAVYAEISHILHKKQSQTKERAPGIQSKKGRKERTRRKKWQEQGFASIFYTRVCSGNTQEW